jgi:(2R)-ethylmalonyl-CoA mutase
MTLIPRITDLLRERGLGDVPVVLGGIVPEADQETLKRSGVAGIYTPGQSTLTDIIDDIVALVAARHGGAARAG